jgi:hypothetical protein
MPARMKLLLLIIAAGIALYVVLSIPILLAGGCGIYC